MREEILERERRFWEALQARDAGVAAGLTADECILVGPGGIGDVGKDAIRPLIKDAPYDLERYAFRDDDVHFRKLGDDLAIVAYKVSEELDVEGVKQALDVYDASVWIRKDGAWVCALHTQTFPGDPYGRSEGKAAVSPTPRAKKGTAKPTRKRAVGGKRSVSGKRRGA